MSWNAPFRRLRQVPFPLFLELPFVVLGVRHVEDWTLCEVYIVQILTSAIIFRITFKLVANAGDDLFEILLVRVEEGSGRVVHGEEGHSG